MEKNSGVDKANGRLPAVPMGVPVPVPVPAGVAMAVAVEHLARHYPVAHKGLTLEIFRTVK